MSTSNEDQPEVPFEDALRRLEHVVAELERGDASLTDALSRYEEGIRLVTQCFAILERADRSVTLLTGVDEHGEADTVPFDDEATT
jgi:exodeoxyribonuclease VII small subunit